MAYYEIKEEEISINRDASTASITLFVPYSDAISYAQLQVGGLQSSFGLVQFFVGGVHPRLPLYCNSVKIKPLGNYDADNLDWLDAEVTLSYGILDQPETEEGVEIGDVSYKVSSEELILPRSTFRIGDGEGEKMDDSIPQPIKIVSKAELQISFKHKPTVNPTSWLNYVGKINASAFYGHPAQTVMFASPETKRSISSDGNDTWQYSYNFVVQPNGWNKVWNPKTAAWVQLTPAQYQAVNLSALFD